MVIARIPADPNVSLDSDLDDSTDGENDSPVGSQVSLGDLQKEKRDYLPNSNTPLIVIAQPRRRTRSLRRTPELENLRGSNDSGFSLENRLGGLDLNSGSGLLGGGSGGTYLPSGRTTGRRERRGAFDSSGSGIATGTTPVSLQILHSHPCLQYILLSIVHVYAITDGSST